MAIASSPPGTGHGFLWRMNAYWLIEPRPEGVYLECRSLSLSRSIPAGLGWLIEPFVTSVPKRFPARHDAGDAACTDEPLR